jgi:D-inositol-3-phosphate glycosyltransferase
MRIALVGPTHPWRGSIAQHTTHLAHALATAGHDVVLESWSRLFPKPLRPGEPNALTEPEVPPFPATRRLLSWHRPDGWWRAGARFLRERSDGVVVVVATPLQVPAYLPMVAIAQKKGEPTPPRIVAICHNLLPVERRVSDQPLMRALLRRLDGVLTHSAAQAELARQFTHAPVHVAALPPHLPLLPGDSVAPPTEAGPADLVYRHLLFLGTVRPYKGLDLLLSALTELAGVRLTVAGEFWGDGLRRTEQLVADLGLTDRVWLRAGPVEAAGLHALFHEVDALVLPYRSGAAGQSVRVAHARGVPVIATCVGTLADEVRDGVDGVVCAPGEAPALAAALRRFYAEGMPQRLRAAVRPVETPAPWDDYVTILAHALGTGPPTASDDGSGVG